MSVFDKWSFMSDQSSSCVESLQWLLACLRQQYMMYQNAHWQASGDGYYGNHLLFQRLYEGDEENDSDEGIQGDIDALAERLVGLFGTPSVDIDRLMPKMMAWCDRWCKVSCHHRRALVSEADFQKVIAYSIKALEKDGRMTIGLKNLLEDLADRHEVNMYLIQQVLRPPGE